MDRARQGYSYFASKSSHTVCERKSKVLNPRCGWDSSYYARPSVHLGKSIGLAPNMLLIRLANTAEPALGPSTFLGPGYGVAQDTDSTFTKLITRSGYRPVNRHLE